MLLEPFSAAGNVFVVDSYRESAIKKDRKQKKLCLPGRPHHPLPEGPPTHLPPSNREVGGGG